VLFKKLYPSKQQLEMKSFGFIRDDRKLSERLTELAEKSIKKKRNNGASSKKQ